VSVIESKRAFRVKYGITRERERRFWAKVAVVKEGCWAWQGAASKLGYGHWRPVQGMAAVGFPRIQLASRIAYGLATGEEPEMACHHCDNPRCVNPRHIYSGDAKTNTRDMIERGRAIYRPRTLTDRQAATVIRRYKKSEPLAKIAHDYGLKASQLNGIVRYYSKRLGVHVAGRRAIARVGMEDVPDIVARRERGESLSYIAEVYSVSVSHISRLARGIRCPAAASSGDKSAIALNRPISGHEPGTFLRARNPRRLKQEATQ